MSNINGKLHFSPRYTFEDFEYGLASNDKDFLIKAFTDRICGFYIKPATKLICVNKDESAFAVGVLCVSTIDCLASITYKNEGVGDRFKKWVTKNLTEFDKHDYTCGTLACRFYNEFRNGLIHEGRIKNRGQFSNVYKELVDTSEGIMLINPENLLNKINDIFEKYITNIEKETDNKEFNKVIHYLRNLNNN